MRKVNIGVWHSVLKLLESSWTDINFDYSKLTKVEKNSISKDEFNHLVEEIKFLNDEKKRGVTYK